MRIKKLDLTGNISDIYFYPALPKSGTCYFADYCDYVFTL